MGTLYLIAKSIDEWVAWCHAVGTKLLDPSISVERILDGVIVPRPVTQRPPLVPLVIEWSEAVLMRDEGSVLIDVAGEEVPFHEVGLELVDHAIAGPLRFRVFTETKSITYEIEFQEGRVAYRPLGKEGGHIAIARRQRSLAEWFAQEPPVIRFENGDFLIGNQFAELKRETRVPFDRARILAWDWAGIDLRVESQRDSKAPGQKITNSIQYHLIQELLAQRYGPGYDLIFDDDQANEAADVVAVKIDGDRLLVHLFHCKYSSENSPGHRVTDLHEVCGQAQRSVYRKGDVDALLTHLQSRETRRVEKGGSSRFELGNRAVLARVKKQARFLSKEFKVIIVQPGLSKAEASISQLDLLASTELYLQETFNVPLEVIGSA